MIPEQIGQLRNCGMIANMLAAVKEIARDHAFDPVLDYLDDMQGQWDGVKRIDAWLTTYCGAPSTPFVRAIGCDTRHASQVGGYVDHGAPPPTANSNCVGGVADVQTKLVVD